MLQKNMEHRKSLDKSTYVSCIKINGVPILPPLITPECRKELLRYKKQAVKLEQRLKNCKELKRNLFELLNKKPLTEKSPDVSFRGNSHIEALGIPESYSDLKYAKLKKISLSRDIVDVSQYSNEGIKVLFAESENSTIENKLNGSNETTSDVESLSKSLEVMSFNGDKENKVLESESMQCPILDLTCVPEKSEDKSWNKCSDAESTPKPRLIRSNSYTLETPSPILLANFNKIGPNSVNSNSHFTRNWTSVENNYVPFESSDYSSTNTIICNENNPDSSMSTPKKDRAVSNVVNKSPTIEVFQTDISVQQVTVNTFDKNEEPANFTKNTTDINDPNSQLMQVLKKIPDDYSNQIIEIIKHQRSEQQQRLQRYDKIAENLVESQKNPEKLPDTGQPEKIRRNSTFSLSPSQSVYYSINSLDSITPTPLATPSVKLIDLDSDIDKSYEHSSHLENEWEDKINEDIRNHNINRELLAKLDSVTLQQLKREWAACVIGAYVKGYLTRRLLKTERVQALIDTIRDALLCALELHSSDTIDEADVELHRRLLQQVSAACFAFHDIFFSLSVQEQMQIISIDRHHKMEKAKRPLSATSSRRSLNSSRSSSNSRSLKTSCRSLTNI